MTVFVSAGEYYTKSYSVTLADIASANYIFTTEKVQLPKGTKVLIYVDEDLVKTVTVS